jgi:Circularly permutated YpsA SLOG family
MQAKVSPPVITIVHGGQTGVDRGAHEAAIANGWPVAGYMPRDGRDERGKIPEEVARFLVAHEKTSYAARTAANVHTASAALFVVRDNADPRATPGTARTIALAMGRRLRLLIVTPHDDSATISRWIWNGLCRQKTLSLPFVTGQLEPTPLRLLIAGPRESKWPGACRQTAFLLHRVACDLAKLSLPAEASS